MSSSKTVQAEQVDWRKIHDERKKNGYNKNWPVPAPAVEWNFGTDDVNSDCKALMNGRLTRKVMMAKVNKRCERLVQSGSGEDIRTATDWLAGYMTVRLLMVEGTREGFWTQIKDRGYFLMKFAIPMGNAVMDKLVQEAEQVFIPEIGKDLNYSQPFMGEGANIDLSHLNDGCDGANKNLQLPYTEALFKALFQAGIFRHAKYTEVGLLGNVKGRRSDDWTTVWRHTDKVGHYRSKKREKCPEEFLKKCDGEPDPEFSICDTFVQGWMLEEGTLGPHEPTLVVVFNVSKHPVEVATECRVGVERKNRKDKRGAVSILRPGDMLLMTIDCWHASRKPIDGPKDEIAEMVVDECRRWHIHASKYEATSIQTPEADAPPDIDVAGELRIPE